MSEENTFQSPEQFNFRRFLLESEGDWWECLSTHHDNFPLDFEQLLGQTIIHPSPTIRRVVAATLLAPSALARNLPILFAIGLPGSGKSNLGKLASKLYNVPVHGSSSTFASARNDFQRAKFTFGVERNAILVLDDIDPGFFIQKPDMFRMLKSGINRSTSMITIAGAMGESIEFDCFGVKVISSISPIFAHPQFTELQRRAFISPHQKLEEADLPDNFLDIDSIEFGGLNSAFLEYWEDIERCNLYVATRRSLSKRASILKKGLKIKTDNFNIASDVIVTLIVCFDVEITEAAELIRDYFKEISHILNKKPQLSVLLGELIVEEENRRKALNTVLGADIPVSIDSKMLRDKVTEWDRNALLDSKVSTEIIVQAMNDLGYFLSKGEWRKT